MITAGSATPAWGSQSLTLQRQSIGGQRTRTGPGRGGGPAAATLPQHQRPGRRRQRQGALLPPALCKHAPGLSAPEATTKRAARRQHEPGKNPAAAWKPSTISSPGWAPRRFAEQLRPAQAPHHPIWHNSQGERQATHTRHIEGSPARA